MRHRLLAILSAAALLQGCATLKRTGIAVEGTRTVSAVDSGGRAITELQSGSSLEMAADGLQPRTLYEFRVTLDGSDQLISYARVSSDARGAVPQFVLWYQSGVIGCSARPADEKRALRFRTFDEAEQALRGRRLRVGVRAAGDQASREEIALDLPITARRSAMVYPSDPTGCLVNALENQSGDVWVAGRNFTPGESVMVSLVPNQRAWRVGDLVTDLTGAGQAAAPKRVTADANGAFRVRAWESVNERRGTYDIVAQRLGLRQRDLTRIDASDIISYGSDTALVLYLLYPPGGPNQDLAGRTLAGFPYFEFADSFADSNDDVWATVDPTYVPAGHPGGQYAGFIVVNHRSVAGWNPGMGGSTAIADISPNGVEVRPVKSGCINVAETIIWPAPAPIGQYDVVVDFGAAPANTALAWATDGNYDSALDFLDGAVQIGYVVAKDPGVAGPTAIGQASYSFDNHFAMLGTAPNVDLRAVVRYPATMAGLNTPVAAGTHPLFVIQHGNHGMCRVCNDGTLFYDRYRQWQVNGTLTSMQFYALCDYTHDTCPDRIKNHEGYMHLLDVLASNGIIAVSIDAYDLTYVGSDYISERADLILKHIEMWSHLNNAATFPSYPDPFAGLFTGHVDLTKVGVSGHSRGGEASVAAYLHNVMNGSPFGIIAVSSIAPVDFYQPVLPAVPYFVIIPSADGDVQDLGGVHHYDRAGSTVADATVKAGIWVYGANHNFFNTIWANDWDDYYDSHTGWPNPRQDFIPKAAQQLVGEAYLAAFTRAYLNNETVYEDMLRGRLTFPSTAGRKIYNFRHETSHAKIDEGLGGGGTAANGASFSSVANPSVHRTTVSRFGWPGSTAMYTYNVPMAKRDASGFETLSFRVAQTNSGTNPAAGPQDFQVELVGGGQSLAVYNSRFFTIPKPYPHPGSVKNVMNTIRIPLHSFIVNNSGVTLNNIDTIRFKFVAPSTGEIYVDDVEFSR